jgi:hypothetical protein
MDEREDGEVMDDAKFHAVENAGQEAGSGLKVPGPGVPEGPPVSPISPFQPRFILVPTSATSSEATFTTIGTASPTSTANSIVIEPPFEPPMRLKDLEIQNHLHTASQPSALPPPPSLLPSSIPADSEHVTCRIATPTPAEPTSLQMPNSLLPDAVSLPGLRMQRNSPKPSIDELLQSVGALPSRYQQAQRGEFKDLGGQLEKLEEEDEDTIDDEMGGEATLPSLSPASSLNTGINVGHGKREGQEAITMTLRESEITVGSNTASTSWDESTLAAAHSPVSGDGAGGSGGFDEAELIENPAVHGLKMVKMESLSSALKTPFAKLANSMRSKGLRARKSAPVLRELASEAVDADGLNFEETADLEYEEEKEDDSVNIIDLDGVGSGDGVDGAEAQWMNNESKQEEKRFSGTLSLLMKGLKKRSSFYELFSSVTSIPEKETTSSIASDVIVPVVDGSPSEAEVDGRKDEAGSDAGGGVGGMAGLKVLLRKPTFNLNKKKAEPSSSDDANLAPKKRRSFLSMIPFTSISSSSTQSSSPLASSSLSSSSSGTFDSPRRPPSPSFLSSSSASSSTSFASKNQESFFAATQSAATASRFGTLGSLGSIRRGGNNSNNNNSNNNGTLTTSQHQIRLDTLENSNEEQYQTTAGTSADAENADTANVDNEDSFIVEEEEEILSSEEEENDDCEVEEVVGLGHDVGSELKLGNREAVEI